MARIKKNLVVVFGATVALALALIVFAALHNFAGLRLRGDETGNRGNSNSSAEFSEFGKAKAVAASPAGGTSEIAKLTLRCRAVVPSGVSGDADITIAYALQKELQKNTTLFDPQTTKLAPEIHRQGNADVVTFDVTVGLKRPIKL